MSKYNARQYDVVNHCFNYLVKEGADNYNVYDFVSKDYPRGCDVYDYTYSLIQAVELLQNTGKIVTSIQIDVEEPYFKDNATASNVVNLTVEQVEMVKKDPMAFFTKFIELETIFTGFQLMVIQDNRVDTSSFRIGTVDISVLDRQINSINRRLSRNVRTVENLTRFRDDLYPEGGCDDVGRANVVLNNTYVCTSFKSSNNNCLPAIIKKLVHYNKKKMNINNYVCLKTYLNIPSNNKVEVNVELLKYFKAIFGGELIIRVITGFRTFKTFKKVENGLEYPRNYECECLDIPIYAGGLVEADYDSVYGTNINYNNIVYIILHDSHFYLFKKIKKRCKASGLVLRNNRVDYAPLDDISEALTLGGIMPDLSSSYCIKKNRKRLREEESEDNEGESGEPARKRKKEKNIKALYGSIDYETVYNSLNKFLLPYAVGLNFYDINAETYTIIEDKAYYGTGCDLQLVDYLVTTLLFEQDYDVIHLDTFNGARFDNYPLCTAFAEVYGQNPDYKISPFTTAAGMLKLTIKHIPTGKTIMLHDLCQHLKCTLKQAGEAYNTEYVKEDFDHKDIQNFYASLGENATADDLIAAFAPEIFEKLESYLANDCRVCSNISFLYSKTIKNDYGMDYTKIMTSSQLAYKIWLSVIKRLFPDTWKKIIYKVACYKDWLFICRGKTGGRSQILTKGKIELEPGYHLISLDFTSLYSTMKDCRFPYGTGIRTFGYRGSKYCGQYEITIVDQPPHILVPIRTPGKPLNWSPGPEDYPYTCVVSEIIIEQFIAHGYKDSITNLDTCDGIYWESHTYDFLKHYVNMFYKLKCDQDHYKSTKDPRYSASLRLFYKQLLNSLTGKFGQEPHGDFQGFSSNIDDAIFQLASGGARPKSININKVGSCYLYRGKKEIDQEWYDDIRNKVYNIEDLNRVYDYSKLHVNETLFRFLASYDENHKSVWENAYCTDTDSLICRNDMADRLRKLNEENPSKLINMFNDPTSDVPFCKFLLQDDLEPGSASVLGALTEELSEFTWTDENGEKQEMKANVGYFIRPKQYACLQYVDGKLVCKKMRIKGCPTNGVIMDPDNNYLTPLLNDNNEPIKVSDGDYLFKNGYRDGSVVVNMSYIMKDKNNLTLKNNVLNKIINFY